MSASLYIHNWVDEIKNELAQQKSINKKSLTLSVIKRILENNVAKQQLITLFEKKRDDLNKDDVKHFLNPVNPLLNNFAGSNHIDHSEESGKKQDALSISDLPVRTYVIATHIYLELNNNELHYETLIRDTTALKEFISAKFKPGKIPGRIEEMKNFSYKKILQSKSAGSAKGQLIPQIKQIAVNPEIFGNDVSAFAESILKVHSSGKK